MSKSNRVLILCNTVVFPSKLFEERGVDFYPFYPDNISVIKKILRRLTLSLGVFRKNFWYGPWFSKLSDYDKLVIFSINGISPLINDLEGNLKKGVTPIIFFWDPVFRVEECLHSKFPKWSFDLSDCRRYDLKFNTTFYFKNLYNSIGSSNIQPECDVYFTGLAKGRRNELNEVAAKFGSLGVKSNFILVESASQKRVSFDLNLENIANSRALLDLVQEGQTGLTVRVMESIYWKKKLVTNNKNIVNEFFYNPKNIFVLGIDDLTQLPAFLHGEIDFKEYETWQEYYDFDNWLNRFNN